MPTCFSRGVARKMRWAWARMLSPCTALVVVFSVAAQHVKARPGQQVSKHQTRHFQDFVALVDDKVLDFAELEVARGDESLDAPGRANNNVLAIKE